MAADHGENRLAKMPSVIVEVGFHTNPGDAAALQDPVFRIAAMKGVEKGYRLNAEGKACEPFVITDIPTASGPAGSPISLPISFKRNPQFPVTRKAVYTQCPSFWTCNGDREIFSESTSLPLMFTRQCNATGSFTTTTFGARTTLTDADGVTTELNHSYTCTPPAQQMSEPRQWVTGRSSDG